MLQFGVAAVWGSYSVGELRCGGVAVCGSCNIGECIWGETHYEGATVITKPVIIVF